MAYRYEGDDLIIDGWERGISSGPYSIFSPSALGPINQTGMVDLSYGNITGVPGEISINFPMLSSTIAGSPPKSGGQIVQITAAIPASFGGSVEFYYALDSFGQIFQTSINGNTAIWLYQGHVGSNSISITGNSGIVWWLGYLITFRAGIAYYSSDGGVTNTDWSSIVGGLVDGANRKYAISSKVSDRVYFCDGSGVGAIILTPGATFNPTDLTTFTFFGGNSPNMVNIPSYDAATCLAELNGQILIGGALNRVYPWDAANLAGTGVTSLVGLPLFLGDRFVQRIVVVNTNAYIFAGNPVIPSGRGYIYIYSGSTIDVFAKMPDNFITIEGSLSDISMPYWTFGDAIWHRNQIMFGAIAIGNKSGSTVPGTGGVWAIDIGSQALYRISFLGSDTDLATALTPVDTGTQIVGLGYAAGISTGSFFAATNNLSTSARVISDKIPVGTRFVPKTFEQLELKLAIALVAGESIDVQVITDLDPGGHVVGSMTSTDGMSRVFTPFSQSSSTGQQGIQWLQVQCVLNPTNTNPTFVRLREIRLR